MSTAKRVFGCCLLIPVVLVGSCAGKMVFDQRMYDLPGPVLQSPLKPTRSLDSGMQVAEALDAYVQPRFEILRDKNFGAFRIVYRQHAGIVQLKVDTQQEKEAIANVNATRRDYMIGLLHCAPRPAGDNSPVTPELQLLYFNQYPFWDEDAFYSNSPADPVYKIAADNKFDLAATEAKAVSALPQLMAGKEHRTSDATWAILMRPVLASNKECLGCHANAVPNATLGVMVYAVRNTRNNPPAQVGMR